MHQADTFTPQLRKNQ